MNIEEIRKKFLSREYEDALSECDREIHSADHGVARADLLRLRACIYKALGDDVNVLNNSLEAIKVAPVVEDYFSACSALIRLDSVREAKAYLEKGLALSVLNGETYYRETMWFLMAFICSELGKITEGVAALDHVSDGFSIWVNRNTPHTKQEIAERLRLSG